MSLLWMEYDTDFQNLADAVFECECHGDPDYFLHLTPKVKKIILRDTRYNIDFLYTAYLLNDDKIMSSYAVWLFELMVGVFKDRPKEETAQYVIEHFGYIREAVKKCILPQKQPRLFALLDSAIQAIGSISYLHSPKEDDTKEHTDGHSSFYEKEINDYLQSLFSKDMRKTMYLVEQFSKMGIPLNDIYVEILAESMYRIGELWHTSKITVDMEHYCTSITQLAMSQLYPQLFDSPRKNKTVLCACPGTELHEMGARMIADLFENDGWDSIYLGAAVPEDAMLDAIRTSHPDLIALSVTMPQHLLDCRDLIDAIRKEFPDAVIAVGGNAFNSTHEIWHQWPIDIYTKDARELLDRANALFGSFKV